MRATTCTTGRCDVSADERDETAVTRSSTVDGGKAPESVDSELGHADPAAAEFRAEPVDPVDPARSALADAQRIAQSGGQRRPVRSRAARRRTRADNLRGRDRGGYSGPGPDERDPQRLGSLLAGYTTDRGWDRPLAEARVFADWPALVGADVASHCTPTALRDGELRIAAESTAWATQLRMLASTMLARLVAELGPDVVTKLVITGPVAPSWKHGGFSVRGARGPRDTYG